MKEAAVADRSGSDGAPGRASGDSIRPGGSPPFQIPVRMEAQVGKKSGIERIRAVLQRDMALIILCLPVIAYYVIFQYLPMYGVTIAFKDFSIRKGILGSDWIGFQNFIEFFRSFYFWRLLRNTFLVSAYSLLWGFPIPIIFALFLNELGNGIYKKTAQTLSYLPHFVSNVVIVSIMMILLSPTDGIVNKFIGMMGGHSINFFKQAQWFRTLYVGSGIWQSFGWNSIIFLAAISGLDPQIYEAATMDGASRLQKILFITLPGIMPTIIIILILSIGNLMSVGYEKIILMYSPPIYETSDVISTYVYRRGLVGMEFSFGAAVGLFNSVINLVLLVTANRLSRMKDMSLW
jgi:putative aldouronate transport system permease protein